MNKYIEPHSVTTWTYRSLCASFTLSQRSSLPQVLVPGIYVVKYDDRLLDCNLKEEKTYKPECMHIWSILKL